MVPCATNVWRHLSQCSIVIVTIASAQAVALSLLSPSFERLLCACCKANQNFIGLWAKLGAGQIVDFASNAARRYSQRAR